MKWTRFSSLTLKLHKLGRGVATCWLEIPRQIAIKWEKIDPATGLLVGAVKGVGRVFARFTTGVYETATFAFTTPLSHQTILEPEFVFTVVGRPPEPGTVGNGLQEIQTIRTMTAECLGKKPSWSQSCVMLEKFMKFKKTPYPPPASIRCLAIPIVLAALSLGACGRKAEPAAPVVRPVRSILVEKHDMGDPIVVTGNVRARDEVSLAFRLSGKLIERKLDVGDTVKAGQTVARLDAEVERQTRSGTQADLRAAQAALEQSQAYEKRMRDLVAQDVIPRNDYDLAVRQLKTAQAQVDAAQAKLNSAGEQVGYAELKSDATGVITQKGAEPGEVVQAGQMILMVARQSGRDAVFNMHAQVIRDGLASGQEVEVWLADNQDIKATGKIREISPQADPVTRNYQVKVELINTPAGMFLGATVVGRLKLQAEPLIEIPSPALTMLENKPAVWVVAANDKCVHLRQIKITRYTPDSVIVTDGLQSGERVVVAGVQELHDGQAVKLLGDQS